MKLADLLTDCGLGAAAADRGGVDIAAITADSRRCGPGVLFVAVPGVHADGHDFIGQARRAGCAAVVAARGRRVTGAGRCPVVRVDDTVAALGALAAAFYGHPARRMTMVALTGTNGKTTGTYILEAIIRAAGGRPGVIGTINYRHDKACAAAPLTTPDPVTLHRVLAEMAAAGVDHVVMEASSHALAQRRLAGIMFDAAYFSNLSRDHLDYHGSLEEYYQAKKKLFTRHLTPGAPAVVCVKEGPEDWGRRLADELRAGGHLRVETCGMALEADWRCREAEDSVDGMSFVLSPAKGKGALRLTSALTGRFNMENAAGMAVLGLALGLGKDAVVAGVAAARRVPGRMERVGGGARGPAVFVDYAHTPDALAQVLAAARGLVEGRLIVVFGCGGDRDRGKRALMGEAAGAAADVVVVTADNSRSERLSDIMEEIERGVVRAGQAPFDGERGYLMEADRRAAIGLAVRRAGPGDVVLICGKGHETRQIGPDGASFFDDRIEAAEALARR